MNSYGRRRSSAVSSQFLIVALTSCATAAVIDCAQFIAKSGGDLSSRPRRHREKGEIIMSGPRAGVLVIASEHAEACDTNARCTERFFPGERQVPTASAGSPCDPGAARSGAVQLLAPLLFGSGAADRDQYPRFQLHTSCSTAARPLARAAVGNPPRNSKRGNSLGTDFI